MTRMRCPPGGSKTEDVVAIRIVLFLCVDCSCGMEKCVIVWKGFLTDIHTISLTRDCDEGWKRQGTPSESLSARTSTRPPPFSTSTLCPYRILPSEWGN